MAQRKGVSLGMVHLDGMTIRAHARAAGARNPQKGDPNDLDARRVKRLAALAEAMVPRLA